MCVCSVRMQLFIQFLGAFEMANIHYHALKWICPEICTEKWPHPFNRNFARIWNSDQFDGLFSFCKEKKKPFRFLRARCMPWNATIDQIQLRQFRPTRWSVSIRIYGMCVNCWTKKEAQRRKKVKRTHASCSCGWAFHVNDVKNRWNCYENLNTTVTMKENRIFSVFFFFFFCYRSLDGGKLELYARELNACTRENISNEREAILE